MEDLWHFKDAFGAMILCPEHKQDIIVTYYLCKIMWKTSLVSPVSSKNSYALDTAAARAYQVDLLTSPQDLGCLIQKGEQACMARSGAKWGPVDPLMTKPLFF